MAPATRDSIHEALYILVTNQIRHNKLTYLWTYALKHIHRALYGVVTCESQIRACLNTYLISQVLAAAFFPRVFLGSFAIVDCGEGSEMSKVIIF